MKRIIFIFLTFICFDASIFAFEFDEIIANREIILKNNNIYYSTVSIKGYASFWIQKYSGGSYLLPQIIEKNIPLEADLKIYNSHQYVDLKTINLEGHIELNAKIDLYSICSSTGDNYCLNYYFIVQINLNGIVKSFCGGYFNEKDFIPFPVLFCSGYASDMRIGLTLHRLKY
ncbi:MAG: hypothetical protein K6357_03225 [Elusimicrobiota bacterium]